MRLIEVVMLVGAHCVSPVEHSQVQMMTDAAKVQCAVVIEKDTVTGQVTVTPQQASADPQVTAALARLGTPAAAPTIVPAFAPAGAPTVEVKPPSAGQVMPAPVAPRPEVADATAEPAPQAPPAATEAPQKLASIAAPPTRPATAKAEAAPARKVTKARASGSKPLRCTGTTVLKWHRTADGKRKYHCVKPSDDAGPKQLY